MEKDDIKLYIKKLEELNDQLSDDNVDIDNFMKELNFVLGGINTESQPISNKLILKFKNESNNEDPHFQLEGDSGFDIRAFLEEGITLRNGETVIIPTGLYFEVEKGFEIQIRSRSGLAAKNKIMVLNSPGTIDSSYRGEIKIILTNLGFYEFKVKNGDRIAQGVVCPVYGEGKISFQKVENLSNTSRNTGGFGHTGLK